jgi:hypothetical protein
VSAGTPRVTLASDDPAVASLSSIDGKITAVNTGAVVVSSSALPSGASTAAKQPALGTAGTASSDVLTIQGVASMTPIQIGDNSSSITVDNGGTFAVQAAQSGTWNITNVSGTVSLPTGASTAAKQPALGTAGTASADVITVQGIASMTALKVDGSAVTQPVSIASSVTIAQATASSLNATVVGTGTFAVQATIASGATSIAKAEDVASADADVGVPSMAVRKATPANTSGTDGDYEFLQMSAGRLWTSATIDTALPAGTNAIGKLASNTGVTIGAVEIASAQTLATVTTVSTVTTCSTVTTLTGGGVAHDGADSGNPIKVGAKAIASLKTTTLVAGADRTDAQSDLDGAILVRDQFPLGDLISERVSNTDGSSTAFTNFAAVASTKNVITSIVAFNSSASAGYIDFRDGTAGSILYTVPIPAGGGAVLPASSTPYFKTSANTALAFDVSAALSTVYISVSGFQSKI